MIAAAPTAAARTSAAIGERGAAAARERLTPLAVAVAGDLVLVRCPRAPWERYRHAARLSRLAKHLVRPSLPGLLAQGGQDEPGAYPTLAPGTPAQ